MSAGRDAREGEPSSAPDPTAAVEGDADRARAAGRPLLDRELLVVYNELRRIAHAHLRRERAGHTLNTTALVHEAYLRLAGVEAVDWSNRSQFLGMASRAMRRVLIDYARSRNRRKRGGGEPIGMVPAIAAPSVRPSDLIALDDALTRLEALEPRQCRVVECRFFADMTNEEAAESLGISPATVKRDWTLARAWLNAELAPGSGAAAGPPGLPP